MQHSEFRREVPSIAPTLCSTERCLQQSLCQNERQQSFLELHESSCARKCYQDLLEQLLCVETTVSLGCSNQGFQPLVGTMLTQSSPPCRIRCRGRFPSLLPWSQLLTFVDVLSIDLLEGGERSQKKLVVLIGMAEKRVSHHYLMLGVLDLVENVVVENKRPEQSWIVLLQGSEHADKIRHLVERDVNFSETLARC